MSGSPTAVGIVGQKQLVVEEGMCAHYAVVEWVLLEELLDDGVVI